ncbi:MAG: DUF3825 domain-containing protein [Deltaproteobacteria bacterium]|nr:DUF3825 domain-containing protein [Deltaproteobacteria bacterium]
MSPLAVDMATAPAEAGLALVPVAMNISPAPVGADMNPVSADADMPQVPLAGAGIPFTLQIPNHQSRPATDRVQRPGFLRDFAYFSEKGFQDDMKRLASERMSHDTYPIASDVNFPGIMGCHLQRCFRNADMNNGIHMMDEYAAFHAGILHKETGGPMYAFCEVNRNVNMQKWHFLTVNAPGCGQFGPDISRTVAVDPRSQDTVTFAHDDYMYNTGLGTPSCDMDHLIMGHPERIPQCIRGLSVGLIRGMILEAIDHSVEGISNGRWLAAPQINLRTGNVQLLMPLFIFNNVELVLITELSSRGDCYRGSTFLTPVQIRGNAFLAFGPGFDWIRKGYFQ